MAANPRLGILVHTDSVEEALACAVLMGATVIRHYEDLAPNIRVVADLDLTEMDHVVAIGERFRMLGVELIVTARPGAVIPFALQRKLTGLSGATVP